MREHVLDPARHLTAQRDGAMAALHGAVLDHDVLRRTVLRIQILAGLDGDAVVTGIEGAAVHQHVVAGFRIEAVAVRSQAVGVHFADHQIAAMDRVVLPERRVCDVVALQQHIGAADQLYHRRPQVVTQAEHAFGDWYAGFGQRRQILVVGTPA